MPNKSPCDLKTNENYQHRASDGPKAKPSLQQKRNTQELPRLSIPQNVIKVEPSCNTVHFDVNLERPGEHDDKTEKSSHHVQEINATKSVKRPSFWLGMLPYNLSWIPNNMHKSHIRPVLRCAICAWISLLLTLIPRTEAFLGRSSFIILLGAQVRLIPIICASPYAEEAAFLSPPSDPFISVLEKETVIQLTASGAYAWSCLGVWLANLARNEFNSSVGESEILNGRYIEAMPSLICAVFLCIGTSILLYLRAKMGQGKPVTAAMILSCTVMDSSLTLAPLYPFPNYQIGKALVVPIAFHTAIALLSSLLIFPESMHAQYRQRFRAVFLPLASALREQPMLLNISSDFLGAAFEDGVESFASRVQQAEAALGPLAASGRLMKKDVSYGRFKPGDFKTMHKLARRMTVRANGMAFYFKIMDPSRHRFPGTPATTPMHSCPPSRQTSHPSSRPSSRPGSLPSSPSTPSIEPRRPASTYSSSITRRRRTPYTYANAQSYFQSHHHPHRHTHASGSELFQEMRTRGSEYAVGVFESQVYLNLEARFMHADADTIRAQAMGLLAESAQPLLLRCADTLEHVNEWLQRVNDDRLWRRLVKRTGMRKWGDIVQENDEVRADLLACLKEFRKNRRHRVLDLYREVIEIGDDGRPGGEDTPPHRYLFQCYLYQYHLIRFAINLIDFLGEISGLESSRLRSRLWLPTHPFRKLFTWDRWDPSDNNINPEYDEDPELVSGIEPAPEATSRLGTCARRDPDALPPTSALAAFARAVYCAFTALGHGNSIFAFKAGFMAALLSLPCFLPQTVTLAIANRSVWAIVLGQTTISRFRGDTVFGLISRIFSTFFGGVVGMAMWYVSSGRGTGNAFALAAVSAVCFPFFFFARIHYPGPPINVTFFFLTASLVISYSWQDTHFPSIAVAGFGFEVAWKRFLMVSIGVTVAFIFSFLPPSTTLRRYLRTTYSTTASQIGQLYCDILSFVTVRDKMKTEELVKNLAAVRMKLNRTRALRKNVTYEFSLQGKWPADRYQRVLDIQMEIAYLLSHLRSVEEHLDPEWARAFLRRTRFMEPDFQGDILSVICMISISLRTGAPLPQITPCPLLDRFVTHHEDLDDYGLPRALTIETLENEQYLYFSVGVATAFGIITRLDRLMHATKELVGEQYHISGVLDMSRKEASEKTSL